MNDDALGRACDAAIERHGYAWLAGALESALRLGHDAWQVADYLTESAQDRSAGSRENANSITEATGGN